MYSQVVQVVEVDWNWSLQWRILQWWWLGGAGGYHTNVTGDLSGEDYVENPIKVCRVTTSSTVGAKGNAAASGGETAGGKALKVNLN